MEKSLPERLRSPKDIDRILKCFNEKYSLCSTEQTCLFPGIHRLLDYLFENDYSVSILSNKSNRLVQPIVRSLLGEWTFSHVSGALESIPKKPDPTIALNIASYIGFAPENCVFVGDSAIDIDTAVAFNMFPIWVSWGYGKEPGNKYFMTVDSVEEIITFLEDSKRNIC